MSRIPTYNAVDNLAAFVQPSSISDAGISRFMVTKLEADGLIRPAGTRKHVKGGCPQRGRPVHLFKLTDKGRKRVKRAGLI